MNELFEAEFREIDDLPHIKVYESTTRAVDEGTLSLRAVGLHTFLRGLAAWYKRTTGKKWKPYATDLAKRTRMSRELIGKIIVELVEAGYIDRHQDRKGRAGLFGGYIYIVYPMQKDELIKIVSP